MRNCTLLIRATLWCQSSTLSQLSKLGTVYIISTPDAVCNSSKVADALQIKSDDPIICRVLSPSFDFGHLLAAKKPQVGVLNCPSCRSFPHYPWLPNVMGGTDSLLVLPFLMLPFRYITSWLVVPLSSPSDGGISQICVPSPLGTVSFSPSCQNTHFEPTPYLPFFVTCI